MGFFTKKRIERWKWQAIKESYYRDKKRFIFIWLAWGLMVVSVGAVLILVFTRHDWTGLAEMLGWVLFFFLLHFFYLKRKKGG